MSHEIRASALPPVVTKEEWQQARAELLAEEKALTRQLDQLAAKRRRLPMVPFDGTGHRLETPDGPKTLLDLFGDQLQLAVYQFMDNGPDDYCPGCTAFTDNVTNLDTLRSRGAAWVTVSDMPLEQIAGYWQQRGWTVPYASSRGTSFAADCGVIGFQLTIFLRDGDQVFKTWTTGSRGVDRLMFSTNLLDLLPYGRQEDWEDSPEGWPQHPTYG
ncbi:DUF899 family protein [Microlunatus speluncae]|uniref:DUF899 family protein n=1 Tax=Microlunatus speluncae TaxID=2594267 RepID=UPI0012664501|nr:DUF899 family protein [Microlunatus speluncae]